MCGWVLWEVAGGWCRGRGAHLEIALSTFLGPSPGVCSGFGVSATQQRTWYSQSTLPVPDTGISSAPSINPVVGCAGQGLSLDIKITGIQRGSEEL